MKIAEVRQLINQYSETQLRYIIAEMYKAIPKSVKESKDIDGILHTPDKPAPATAARKKKIKIPDMDDVSFDAEEFISYGYNRYYFVPNSFVSKRERPKWRFIARRLHKDLVAAAADIEQLPEAADLLKQIYELLCHGCAFITFTGSDPFQSVGVSQAEFFRSVLTLQFRRPDLIIREYEAALKAGVTPRDGLRRTYNAIRKTGELPDYFA